MTLTKEEVQKIASLARIRLTEQETTKLTQEMGDILNYFEKLNKVDTKGVDPTAQVTGLENVFRPDDVSEMTKFDKEKLLNQAPDRKEDYVKVKAVFND